MGFFTASSTNFSASGLGYQVLTAMSTTTQNFLSTFITNYWQWILGITVVIIIGKKLLGMARFTR